MEKWNFGMLGENEHSTFNTEQSMTKNFYLGIGYLLVYVGH